MDNRILDLVSTKYISQKLAIEVDLEKLINNPPIELQSNQITELIMDNVKKLRTVSADHQMWESIISQLTKPEERENNK